MISAIQPIVSHIVDPCNLRIVVSKLHLDIHLECFLGSEPVEKEDEYILVLGKSTIRLYDQNFTAISLPNIPSWPDHLDSDGIGGTVGGKIVACTRFKCYSWSKDQPSSWTFEFNTEGKFVNHRGSSVTTKNGIWVAGGHNSNDAYLITFSSKLKNQKANLHLEQDRSSQCIIENRNTPIVTGGYRPRIKYLSSVDMYNLSDGTVTKLPNLNQGRSSHGCAKFKQHPSDVEWSYIVAGGYSGSYLSSIEILYKGAKKWIKVNKLPARRSSLSMATINHKVEHE